MTICMKMKNQVPISLEWAMTSGTVTLIIIWGIGGKIWKNVDWTNILRNSGGMRIAGTRMDLFQIPMIYIGMV